MTKIVILDQKLIVSNDYLQFWVHFEWFLSLFQILYVKQLLSLFKLKIRKNGILVSNPIFRKFSNGILVPRPFLYKKQAQIGPQISLYRGGWKTPYSSPSRSNIFHNIHLMKIIYLYASLQILRFILKINCVTLIQKYAGI